MVPFIHQAVLAYANLMAAFDKAGVRAHAGHLVLAKATSAIQQARPGSLVCIACVGSFIDTVQLPAHCSFCLAG